MNHGPFSIAAAVVAVMGGSTVEAIVAPQRGTPRTAELRAVTMLLWRLWSDETPTYTDTGIVFGRDRRNVQRGLARIAEAGIPTRKQITAIRRKLNGEGPQQQPAADPIPA